MDRKWKYLYCPECLKVKLKSILLEYAETIKVCKSEEESTKRCLCRKCKTTIYIK
jgi:hypothetical protein